MISRLYFLILCLLTTLPAHAERYSSGGEAFFVGVLQVLFLMFVFWVWKLIKGSKYKDKDTLSQNSETSSSNDTRQSLGSLKTVNTQTQVNDTASSKAMQPPSMSPWEKFKSENSAIAKNMELQTDEDLQCLAEKDIFEKVATLKRMSKHFDCPISDLKDVTINKFVSKFSIEELREVIYRLSVKSEIESHKFRISEKNTMSHYIQGWLSDYLYKTSNE